MPRVISDVLAAYTSWAKAEDTVVMKHKIRERWPGGLRSCNLDPGEQFRLEKKI